MSVRRIHHLNCGTMRPPARALLGQSGPPLARGVLVCHCVLVETDRDGLVLIDTGFGEADVANPRRVPPLFRVLIKPRLDERETARGQITALGYDPRDVRHVIVTHLDVDHASGMVDFPDATVHVHAREHAAAMQRRTAIDRARYVSRHWAHGPKWQVHAEQGDTWRELPAITRLPGLDADIGLLPLFGHTRGHSGVIVRAGDRWLVHAGDAYFHPRTLAGERGKAPLGLRLFETVDQVDRKVRLASVTALRRLRLERDIDVVCAHDPTELAAAQAREPARDAAA